MERKQSWWLLLILLCYLAVGSTYILATPPLEASDEYKHYPVVQHIQAMRALPVLDPDNPGRWLQEGVQPPLYYVLMAAITAWIDTSDLAEVHQLNEHAYVGDPNQIGNKNLIIHRPEREAWPWHDTVLAVYVIRLASLALGAGTVILVHRLGRELFEARTGLLAAALTAFNPMFLFVHAAVNNDSLAILLGHLGLWLLLRLWRDAPDPGRAWPRYAMLGIVLGLGTLTKLSLGGLLGMALLALTWRAWRQRNRWLFSGAVMVGAVALALIMPWLRRNLALYGDPTGLNVFIAVQGARDRPITWTAWLGEFGTFYRSFWGLFGGVNVAAPEFLYNLYNVIALIGTAGFGQWWRRHKAPAGLWLLVAWPLLLFALLLRWTLIYAAFQGRLIFPALGALNVLWAVGLQAWLPAGWRPQVAAGAATLALLVAAALPWLVIRPAYIYPEPLAVVPEGAAFGPITFHAPDGVIEVVGVEMAPSQSVTPGGRPVEVTLYWRAVEPVEHDYLSSVHLLGQENASVGFVNRHPAMGAIPTGRWTAGQIWRDDYRVFANRDAPAPARLRLLVSLFDSGDGATLAATGPDGAPIALVIVGEARLAGKAEEVTTPAVPVNVALAEGITLWGYTLEPQPAVPGETVRLTLTWRATAAPTKAYTVFIHLLGPDGTLVLTADAPPLNGDYPTDLWQPGDVIEDTRLIELPATLPAGEYQMAVGLYEPISGQRLPRLDGAGDSVTWEVEIGD